ncbi:hypothetical protein [Marinicrinis lubricantis]|uniref:Membrane protein YkvI n=1 Tax=Marinicrinis lubricantis TaxID=2086470 RepID=A0ABW1IMV7_9BACL
MKRWLTALQIAFTYIGTIVGAGFATGQEILQFFTKYGRWGTLTILAASILFVWLGTKLMLSSQRIGAKSYEDLNRHLFGPSAGKWVSRFLMLFLFGISSVMLAGAGTVFKEHFQISYQIGLLITILLSYLIIRRGMKAIFTVNSIVVPLMFCYICFVVVQAVHSPSASNWVEWNPPVDQLRVWLSPLLYTAFNLGLAQAVLVPIGGHISDRSTIRLGGMLGGLGVGIMLLALHFSLSSQMPSVALYEIPMARLAFELPVFVQLLFILIIFAEIFTTFIADIYGLVTQLEDKTPLSQTKLLVLLLAACFMISQIGFSSLLSTLYPLFGIISSAWLAALIIKRNDDS